MPPADRHRFLAAGQRSAFVTHRLPYDEGELHKGWAAVQGAGRSTRPVSWAGGTSRALVVDSVGGSLEPAGSKLQVRGGVVALSVSDSVAHTDACPVLRPRWHTLALRIARRAGLDVMPDRAEALARP